MKKIDCLAFGPHPDDVELFCSGLLIKLQKQGFNTGVIDLTRGELSTNGDTEIRGEEAQKASKVMKLSVRENAEFEDGNIENNRQNRLKLIKIIRMYKPDLVIQPHWEDRHPDHINASKIITDVCFYSGLKKIDTGQEPHRPKAVLYYMMHKSFLPSFIVDITDEISTKLEAIQCYESQIGRRKNNTQNTYINKPEFFDSIVNRAKFYGYEIKSEFGEPYFCKDVLRINNIMEIIS